jgi:hypothetical protein
MTWSHDQVIAIQWQQLLDPNAVLLDLKGMVPRELGVVRL